MLVHFLAHFVLAVSDSDDFAELGEENISRGTYT